MRSQLIIKEEPFKQVFFFIAVALIDFYLNIFYYILNKMGHFN